MMSWLCACWLAAKSWRVRCLWHLMGFNVSPPFCIFVVQGKLTLLCVFVWLLWNGNTNNRTTVCDSGHTVPMQQGIWKLVVWAHWSALLKSRHHHLSCRGLGWALCTLPLILSCRLDSGGRLGSRRHLVSSVCSSHFALTWHLPADVKNSTSLTTHPNVVTFAVEGAVAELRPSVSRCNNIKSGGGGCHAQRWSSLVIINSFWFLWKKKEWGKEFRF